MSNGDKEEDLWAVMDLKPDEQAASDNAAKASKMSNCIDLSPQLHNNQQELEKACGEGAYQKVLAKAAAVEATPGGGKKRRGKKRRTKKRKTKRKRKRKRKSKRKKSKRKKSKRKSKRRRR